MPRRTPRALRATLRVHPRVHQRFGGLSPVVLDHIARVEDHPGATLRDLREWQAIARQPWSAFPTWSDNGLCRICDHYGHPTFCRDGLEEVLSELPAFAAQRLAAVIQPVDDAFRARMWPGPSRWAGAPWWHACIRPVSPDALQGVSRIGTVRVRFS